MKIINPVQIIVPILAMVFLGCSMNGSAGSSPVTPVETVLSGNSVDSTGSGSFVWGYYEIDIDIPTQTVTAVPLRHAMFTANVTKFINAKPSNLGFHINDITTGSDYIDVDIDVTITHPFPGLTQYNGYDVRGIFIGNGSSGLYYSGGLWYPIKTMDQFMLPDPDDGYGGADGYTRWFNPTEFKTPGLFGYIPGVFASKNYKANSKLCPCKYFADGLDKNQNLWDFLTSTSGNGVFSAGSSNTRNYYLRFPNSVGVKYCYAIIANWGGIDPADHPSNAPEAVGCKVVDSSNLWYLGFTQNGGSIIFDISLFGWEYQPSKIFIEAANVLNDPYELTSDEMIPIGGGEHFSTYHVEIPADGFIGSEEYECWVIAEYDDFDYSNDFGVPNLAGADPLAAFFRFGLEVSNDVDTTGWARTWGGTETDRGYAVAVDDSGIIYATGGFSGSVDFDPGVDEDIHDSNGESDIYLCKYAPNGDFLWAKTWGGIYVDNGRGIFADDVGNVYVTGEFEGTVDFDPGDGIENHSSVDASDAYLCKFDADGNFIWARTWGAANPDFGWGCDSFNGANIWVAGWFRDTVDFDPGSGIVNGISNGNNDIFLSKFDSSGNFKWVRTWGGTGNDMSRGIAVDSNGNSHVTGFFAGTADFDTGGAVENHTSLGAGDVFLSRFNSAGDFIWARTWGGTLYDQGRAVAVDGLGSIEVTGWFADTVDFDPGTGTEEQTSNGVDDAFVSKFDSSGSFSWARTLGGFSFD
ncbi:MAG: SBBP repeat-containing protein, partial [bacterium]